MIKKQEALADNMPDFGDLDSQRVQKITLSYNNRLKTLKKARESFQKNEIKKAVDNYFRYLNGLAMWKRTTEEHLSPSHFDKTQDLAELLLISHVYWDLAKSYDRNPKLNLEVTHCLKQFCKFTIGLKYQYANAQVVKKFIKRPIVRNKNAFQHAYNQVRIRPKGCYIATHSLGQEHPITFELRIFRDTVLENSRIGILFLKVYYTLSPLAVTFLTRHQWIDRPINTLVIRPFLYSIGNALKVLRK